MYCFFSCLHIFYFIDSLLFFSLSADNDKRNSFFICIGKLFSEFIWVRIVFKIVSLRFELRYERESGFKTIFKIYDQIICNSLLFEICFIKNSTENSADPDTSSYSAVILSFSIDISGEICISSSTTDRSK